MNVSWSKLNLLTFFFSYHVGRKNSVNQGFTLVVIEEIVLKARFLCFFLCVYISFFPCFPLHIFQVVSLIPSAALLDSLLQVKASFVVHWFKVHLMGWLSKIFKVSNHKVSDGRYGLRYDTDTSPNHQSTSSVCLCLYFVYFSWWDWLLAWSYAVFHISLFLSVLLVVFSVA